MQNTITSQPRLPSLRRLSPRRTWLPLLGLTALTLIGQPAFSAPPTDKFKSDNPAQERSVSGKVLSGDDNTALPGVSVAVKGTTRGTTTDANGEYRINIPTSQAVLVFSAVGFVNQEVSVGNKSAINITLTTDTRALNEVVVVGYGSLKKSQTTGAISSVTPKQITEQPVTNIGQAMQGRVAGVDVAQSGSRPGSVPTIRIRGRRSFNAGNDPLYVVDGIPLAREYEDINPNDVGSMEILKDATATAIYGARGANGVVLVTTKRGNPTGKTTISYDNYVGFTDALDKVHLFSGSEFAEFVREAYRTTGNYKDVNGNPVPTGVADAYADSKVAVLGGDPNVAAGLAANRNTDWQSLILKQGIQQNHSLGIQGGNEKTQFYISAGFFQDKGIMPGLDFTRYSLRANVDHQINKALKVGLASYMMYYLRNGENLNPYNFTLQQNPLGRPYDDNGNLIFSPTNDALLTNPLAEVIPGAQIEERKKYRIFNSVYAEVSILDGLKYRVNFGPDFTINRYGRFIGAQTNARKFGDPQASNAAAFNFDYTLENVVTYNKKIGDHNFGITALQSIQRDNSEFNNINVQGVPAETQQFYNVGNASSVLGVSSGLIQWTINSYMGRVNYDYKDKYLVTATLRRDGSSRFGENTKYGNFPGIALGWNINNEDFMKGSTWVDLLKLRVSRGSVGNQGVAPYQTQGLLGRTVYAFGTTPAYGYRPETIGNPDLRWETSTTTNIGVDFSLWRGRVTGAVELYQTRTTDLLLSDQLPTSIGFNAVTRNIGETQNKGLEASISTVNVNTKGGFKWTSDIVFTKNTESIISLFNGPIDDVGNKRFIGKPLTEFYDYKKAGIWQTNEADAAKSYQSAVGQIKVQDTNNDGKITADDRVFLGSDIPTWSGGITNRFSYKGFDLNFFIYARIGQTILSGFHRDNNQLAGRYQQIKVDYWTPNNPTNEFPRPNSSQEFPVYNQAIYYFDGSFVKVRNINFGYTFPASITSKLRMQSLRLFASIQQPFIFSSYRSKYNGVDPETSATDGVVSNGVVPATRVTTFGLNVKF
ncbi:SusC/RagA family TonB-linked outer membrane protein [Spirosoma endbachense]|uniref:SusC/RagA family TonB-linked outer membrane protein n=1 Tax=Spirosoma endbachense TaxID=2666025 RepID=A0A6P1W4G9_9BACT|nr:TonB-dependent receptor [Spirosoma endbachense]QHV99468.1 SusC/RagA family TonB-linked outer membrane protein [Spirosoma endbachense]